VVGAARLPVLQHRAAEPALREARHPAAHVPPELGGRARELYAASIERAWADYRALTRRLAPIAREILGDLWHIDRRANKAFGKSLAREAEKKAIETARYVIPVACHTAMVYTISGLVLHRCAGWRAVGDVPGEAARVIALMVAEVERLDPSFFGALVTRRSRRRRARDGARAAGIGDASALEAFDKSLGGRTSRLVDWSARAPEVVADAVRHVLGRADLRDADALAAALDPKHQPYRLENLNVSTHSPVMRALAHAHFVFRKKLSHTADSQDQRHRTVPGSRPLLVAHCAGLARRDRAGADPQRPASHRMFEDAISAQWRTRAALLELGASPEVALYVLPNALAVRFEESGTLLDLLHKWTMRSCLNAQWEIWRASMDEIEQVRAVHPRSWNTSGRPAWCAMGSRGRAAPRERTSVASRYGAASPRSSAGSDGRAHTARATAGDLAAVTSLWIQLTDHHAALDPHFALRPVRRTRRAACSRRSCAIPTLRSSCWAIRPRARARRRAPRTADPSRDVSRRDHRPVRGARAASPRMGPRARRRAAQWARERGAGARRGARVAAQRRRAGVLARRGLRRVHARAAPSIGR
jgi:thymidylate synthase ThyX